jgi:hypothetical protein
MGFNLEGLVGKVARNVALGGAMLLPFAAGEAQPYNSQVLFAQQQKDQQPEQKAPVPNVSAQKMMDLHEVYTKELAVKDKDKVKEAIDRMVNDALATKNDPATQYALLTMAYQKAKEFSDFSSAFKTVDELDKRYTDADFKPFVWKANVLDDARKKNPKAEQLEALVGAEIDFAAYEVTLGFQTTSFYDEAVKAAKNAVTDAKTLKNKPFEDKATAIQKYAADLSKDGKDALTQAKFKYFIQGDSGEEVLKALSAADGSLKKLAGLQTMGGKDPGHYYEYFETAYAAANDAGRLPHEKRDLQTKALDFYRTAVSKAEGVPKKTFETKGAKMVSELEKALSGNSATIDLLKLIDTTKDTVSGSWKLQNGKLNSENAGLARIELPYSPPEEYDFRIVFTRTQGNNDVNQMLYSPTGKTSFALHMGGWDNMFMGFSKVKGASGNANPTTTKTPLENNHKYEAIIKVRKDGITATLDGVQKCQYKTNYNDISEYPDLKLKNPQCLGLGSYMSAVTFESVQVKEITGKGKLLR